MSTQKYTQKQVDFLLSSHTADIVGKLEGLKRYDVYDGGEAENVDGDYVKVSDLTAINLIKGK